jgi:hypothetical protein
MKKVVFIGTPLVLWYFGILSHILLNISHFIIPLLGRVFKVFYQVDCEQEASSTAKYSIFSNLIRTLFSFRGLKNQMRIRSGSRAGFWKNDVLLIIQQLLFVFWELLAYCCPTLQNQPHRAHKPHGTTFTAFKTTSRKVQRFGILYCLLAK